MSEKDITRLERALENLTRRVDHLSTHIAELRGERHSIKWITALLCAGGGIGATKLIQLLTGG